MTPPPETPRDFTPYFIATLAALSLILLTTFFVRHGTDLISFVSMVMNLARGDAFP